jgi:hypothetical protein
VTEPVYATPAAFKQALEQRLRTAVSLERVNLARRRQLLVFDRFLARVFAQLGERVCLKGGLVLELRLERARTTNDVDLRCIGAPERIVEELRSAGRLHLGDFMTFELAPHSQHPVIHNDGMKYDGLRLRAECRLAGKLYGQPFGVDVAFGDPLTESGDVIVAHDSLAFARVPPPRLVVYPIETQIAEKLHAYTMPRARPNTRVKDLPDIALLATARELDASRVRAALQRTFEYRATHPLPVSVPEAPAEWSPVYAMLAREDRLPWASLDEVLGAVRAFLDPILADDASVTWSPQSWSWSKGRV